MSFKPTMLPPVIPAGSYQYPSNPVFEFANKTDSSSAKPASLPSFAPISFSDPISAASHFQAPDETSVPQSSLPSQRIIAPTVQTNQRPAFQVHPSPSPPTEWQPAHYTMMPSPLGPAGLTNFAKPGEPANANGHRINCHCCKCRGRCKNWMLDD